MPRLAVNSVEIALFSPTDDDSSGSPVSAAPSLLMALNPSCAEDFTAEWVLHVMQQYYEANFNESIAEIGKFVAE